MSIACFLIHDGLWIICITSLNRNEKLFHISTRVFADLDQATAIQRAKSFKFALNLSSWDAVQCSVRITSATHNFHDIIFNSFIRYNEIAEHLRSSHAVFSSFFQHIYSFHEFKLYFYCYVW